MKFKKEREAFESWFLSLPDVDEALLKQDGEGSYCDQYVSGIFTGFCAGWNISKTLSG